MNPVLSASQQYLNQTVCLSLSQSVPPTGPFYLDATSGVVGTVPQPFSYKGTRWFLEPTGDQFAPAALRCLSPTGNGYLDASPGQLQSPVLAPNSSSPTTHWNVEPDGANANYWTIYCWVNNQRLYLQVYFASNGSLPAGTVWLTYNSTSSSFSTPVFNTPTMWPGVFAGQFVTLRPYLADSSGADLYLDGGASPAAQLRHSYEAAAQFWAVSNPGDLSAALACTGIQSPGQKFLDGLANNTVVLAGDTTDGGTHWAVEQNPANPWLGNDGIYRLTGPGANPTNRYLAPPAGDPPPDGGAVSMAATPQDWIVTIASDAPVGGCALSSYTSPNLEHVIWRGTDNRIQQLVLDSGKWARHNLTAWAGAPAAPGAALSAFSTPDQYVFYLTTDGHVRFLLWNDDAAKWVADDLDLGETSRSDSPVTSYVCDDVLAVGYITADNHVHQIARTGGWADHDLGSASVATGSPLTSYSNADDNSLQVIAYIGTDNCVHQLAYTGGWADHVISGAWAEGSALASYVTNDPYQCICYVGSADNHVHQLAYLGSGGWYDNDLTQIAAGITGSINATVGSALTAYCTQDNVQAVAYIGTDGHVHQLACTGNWGDHDLTQVAGAVLPAAGTLLTSYLGSSPREQMISYIGADNHVHQLTWSGSAWSDLDLTNASI